MGFLGYFGIKVFKGEFKIFANSARVKHFRNLKRLRRFFSKGLNYLITQNFKFLKNSFVILLESELKGRGRAFSFNKLQGLTGLLR
ncbi:TPA: hypothetical protein R1X69_001101 [Campylobacter upsaliensis]|nr:hypothetical protein [Campylobacter upsaliensis]